MKRIRPAQIAGILIAMGILLASFLLNFFGLVKLSDVLSGIWIIVVGVLGTLAFNLIVFPDTTISELEKTGLLKRWKIIAITIVGVFAISIVGIPLLSPHQLSTIAVDTPIYLTGIPSSSAQNFTISGNCYASLGTIRGNNRTQFITATSSCAVIVTAPNGDAYSRYVFANGASTWNFTTCAADTSSLRCPTVNAAYYYQVSNNISLSTATSQNVQMRIQYMSGSTVMNETITSKPQSIWSNYGAAIYPIFIKTSSSFNLGNSFTVTALVNVTKLGGWQTVFANSPLGTSNNGIRLAISPDGVPVFEIGSDGKTLLATCPHALFTGLWQNLRATFLRIGSNTSIALYANGVLCQTFTNSPLSPNTDQPIAWGCDTNRKSCLVGRVGGFHIYPTAQESLIEALSISTTNKGDEYFPISGGNNLTFKSS